MDPCHKTSVLSARWCSLSTSRLAGIDRRPRRSIPIVGRRISPVALPPPVPSGKASAPIGRTRHTPSILVQPLGIDRGRAHVLVPEPCLYGPDVVAVPQQVGGTGVAACVTGGERRYSGRLPRCLDGLLENGLMTMVPPLGTGARVHAKPQGWTHPIRPFRNNTKPLEPMRPSTRALRSGTGRFRAASASHVAGGTT